MAPARLEPVPGFMYVRIDIVDKEDNQLLFREIIRMPEDPGWQIGYVANPLITSVGASKTYAFVMVRVL